MVAPRLAGGGGEPESGRGASRRVRVTRSGLPSLAAACRHLPRPTSLAIATARRHSPRPHLSPRFASLAITRRGPSHSPRPASLALAGSGLQSFRLAAAPVTPGLQGPVLLATARASQVRVTHRGRSHSPRPEVTRRGPSPGHSGAAARRHSARPATGNRRGPPLLAAARRHSPPSVVRDTAAHRCSPRPHSPRPASRSVARARHHSPWPESPRRGRPSFTSLSHSRRRRPSRPPRLEVTCRGPSPS